ncbi:MAG: hypothetical protein U0L91_05215 [Gemmiger sp.]|uniref:hypothetical protein n=1 Tax=Gemmiger sp. TaxID=2049027 RepID=UPI002E769F31|nr:hypothetical protein [Gemmiger sp.]MEE0800662.1 hypothetical protein [Gemmiger sp.]
MKTSEDFTGRLDRKATEKLERNVKAMPAGFVRKEAQVQWQTLKIPFITGGPGPAENKRTTLTAAGHYLFNRK